MIFVEDRLVKVGGVVLPGLLKSIEVTETAKVDEQEVEGSAVKPKQATGYEDAGSTLSSYSMIPRRQRSTSASRRYAPPSENRGRKSRSLSRSCAKTQRRTV